MTDHTLRLVVILGSVRDGRFGPTVANWFAREAGRHGRFEVDLVDISEFPLPLALSASDQDTLTKAHHAKLSARLSAADAFVVVTPEYNHSFPAALKNTIDWCRKEWWAKPVGLLSYGGRSGGIRAAEQLRQVFPELHALTVREALSFHNAENVFDDDGEPRGDEAVAAKSMLDQLDWWGTALRQARDQRPYGA